MGGCRYLQNPPPLNVICKPKTGCHLQLSGLLLSCHNSIQRLAAKSACCYLHAQIQPLPRAPINISGSAANMCSLLKLALSISTLQCALLQRTALQTAGCPTRQFMTTNKHKACTLASCCYGTIGHTHVFHMSCNSYPSFHTLVCKKSLQGLSLSLGEGS